MKKVFTLDGVPPKDRVDIWRTALTETFAPVDLTGFNPDGFNVQLETAMLGDIEVSHLSGVEQGIVRPRRIIHSSDADPFVAVVQLGGSMSYQQRDRGASGLAGSVTLFDMTQEYQFLARDRLDIIDVTIPRKRIEALFGSTRDLAGLTLDADHPMAKLVIAHFRNQMQMPDDLNPEAAARLGTLSGDLLAAAFLEKMGRTPAHAVGGTAAIMRVKAFIRDRLGDPTLTSEIAAASQNMSLRRMQELFAAESHSISDYIWEQRMLRAKGMLESQAFARLSVTEIAYAVGFVSLPHFSRRFRTRFGCSPGEVRQSLRFIEI